MGITNNNNNNNNKSTARKAVNGTLAGQSNKKDKAHRSAGKRTFQKRRPGSDRNNGNRKNSAVTKKIKFHSTTITKEQQQQTSSVYEKLNPNIVEQYHKIEQRRKTIMKGKNTIGYDEYCKQIPKHKRRKYSMETPMTPDHTINVPNKKWNGIVKAWRIALHRYDPKELQQSFREAQRQVDNEESMKSLTEIMTTTNLSVKEQELEYAKTTGILNLVNMQQHDTKNNDNMMIAKENTYESNDSNRIENLFLSNNDTNVSSTTTENVMNELNKWKELRGDNESAFSCSDGEDVSDDDLL